MEGYVESISSGMLAALNAIENFTMAKIRIFRIYSYWGLAKYISTPNDKFQPNEC